VRKVIEGSAIQVVVSPFDFDGDATTPTSARYRIDDESSGTEITGWTDIASLSDEMTIDVTATENAIVNSNLAEEVKVVTVQTDYSTGDQQTATIEYVVENKQFVT
jgi:hypothetical protein